MPRVLFCGSMTIGALASSPDLCYYKACRDLIEEGVSVLFGALNRAQKIHRQPSLSSLMTAKPTSHNQLLCFSPCPGVSLSPLLFIPSQIVIWLPALCRKMDVPYCIVKGKARLGQVVHKKTATVLAFTDVKKEDQSSFNKLTESIRNNFNERADTFRKTWGGGIMGSKTIHKVAIYEKNRLRELAAREGK